MPSLIIVFILIFIVVLFPEFDNFDSEKPEITKLNRVYQGEINSYTWIKRVGNVDGIILGSSTLRYGISCEMIKSEDYPQWINLSMDARDPIVFYLLLKEYTKHIQPKIVLVGLDPWIYSKYYYRFRDPVMLDDLNFKQKLNYFLYTDLQLPLKLIRNKFNLIPKYDNAIKRNYEIPRDFGSRILKRRALNFTDGVTDFFEIKKYGWSNLQFVYLRKIKQHCDSSGIKIVFLVPPYRSDFVYAADGEFLEENTTWWKQICRSIGGGLCIGSFNAMNDKKQDSIFVDNVHLSKHGQSLFSIYVKNQIENSQLIKEDYPFLNPH